MKDDDLQILNLILDRLINYSKDDMSAFRSKNTVGFDDYDSGLCDVNGDTIWTRKKSRNLIITWNPKENSWKPEVYDYNGTIELRYIVAEKTVSIYIDYNCRHIEIGAGSENKEFKIKFIQLIKAIEEWEEIEIPRREREEFIQKTTKVFPDILDHLILEDEDAT